MKETIVRVASDVGGTFTDLVFLEINPASGHQVVRTAKADTTPPDFEKGVLNVLAKAEVELPTVDFMAHGTTVIINALTERKGVKTALITTKGFRDCLEIARGNRPDFFNLRYVKPPPFVPRYLRRELSGRMDYEGRESLAPDLSELPAILEDFRAESVQAVAICFLHAYANPVHEIAVFDEVKRLWPDVACVASHQITREWREYERTSTTVLSAYVQPAASRYLGKLNKTIADAGFAGPLYIMQSNCGVDTVEAACRLPITMVESGPASGFLGAAALGRTIGEPNILALDIGGTTAKCALIEDGAVKITSDYWIERDRRSSGYPIMVPVVDLVEIGNGGGSIATVDEFGKLHVGPQSAGADPGPAAYGRGGLNATTTDANLALRRINPDYFCGGEITADMNAVDQALNDLGRQLGMTRTDVARGIVRIANNNMVNALKLVSLNRGRDPRDFVLVAFGGGGGMHAAALGRELGVKKIIVPANAPVFSAWGMMMSDLRRDYFATRVVALSAGTSDILTGLLCEIEDQARRQFAAEGLSGGQIQFARHGRFRYLNQEHAVEIPLPSGPIAREQTSCIAASFADAYEKEYSYRLDAPIELVGVHVIATAEIGKLDIRAMSVAGRSLVEAKKGTHDVDFVREGVQRSDIYDGTLLEPGMTFCGPAIIEDPGTTTVVHVGQTAAIDSYGNICIESA
ncbi:MAG: hydantoinase/oxoprolinase family protein [Hyphomicrobiaceae bacterium]